MIIIKRQRQAFKKKTRERYQNLSAEEKYKKRQYRSWAIYKLQKSF